MRFHLLAGAALALIAAPALAQEEASSPIRLNQAGLVAKGAKRAILPSAAAEPLTWELLDAGGQIVLTGKTEPYGMDASSGEPVHLIDFSPFWGTGEGYLLRAGDALSRPFAIGAGPYDALTRDALAYFYHNRAGTPIEARFVGETWARPAGHAPEVASCFEGKDQRGTAWPGCDYSLDVTGGWYDAGDQGKYVVNGGITLWTLQNLYETGGDAFPDNALRIPEGGNGVSDLLDEARYEMEFLLKMQVPDGAKANVAVGHKDWRSPPSGLVEIDAGGMAHHKVADATWTALPTAPHEDREPRLLYPPSTAATLNLAAVAAQCARLWREIDDAFATRCLEAAQRAWAAAERNPEVYSVGAWTGSGGYGDNDVSDEFYWAAAELFATTGEARYGEALRASPHFTSDVAEPGWPRVAALGTITLATGRSALPKKDVDRLRTAIVAAADRFLADSGKTGYAIPYAPEPWIWGSTSVLMNRAMLLAHAADFTGEAQYRDGVIDAMDFLLGRNALDRSFVSGYGARPMQNPHHRFWAHQADARYPGPPPGALSGGPNSSDATDTISVQMKGKCTGQTCWADHVFSYATNEVAINWNAPLAWVSAWLADGED